MAVEGGVLSKDPIEFGWQEFERGLDGQPVRHNHGTQMAEIWHAMQSILGLAPAPHRKR